MFGPIFENSCHATETQPPFVSATVYKDGRNSKITQ